MDALTTTTTTWLLLYLGNLF